MKKLQDDSKWKKSTTLLVKASLDVSSCGINFTDLEVIRGQRASCG